MPAANGSANRWLDSPSRYGLISRLFHWVMAVLILWQFAPLAGDRLIRLAGIDAIEIQFPSHHGRFGTLILIVVGLRLIWVLINRRRRPHFGNGVLDRVAAAGHVALYALLVAVPGVALLRQYGSGWGWNFYGVQLVPSTGETIDWIIRLTNFSHSKLGWALLALIVGHTVMALVHQHLIGDDTLRRMTGSFQRSGGKQATPDRLYHSTGDGPVTRPNHSPQRK